MDVQTSVYTESASSAPISTAVTTRDVNMISANNSNQFSPSQAPQTNLSANSYHQLQISRTHQQQQQHNNHNFSHLNHTNLPNVKQHSPATQHQQQISHQNQYTIAPQQPQCFGTASPQIASYGSAPITPSNNNFLSNNVPGQFVAVPASQSGVQCSGMNSQSLNSYSTGLGSFNGGNIAGGGGGTSSVNLNNSFSGVNSSVNNSNNNSVNSYGTNFGNQSSYTSNIGSTPTNNTFASINNNNNNNNNNLVSSSQPSISTRYPAKIHYKLNRSSPTNPGGGGSGNQTANNSPNTSNVSSPIGSDQCSPLVSPSSTNNVNNRKNLLPYQMYASLIPSITIEFLGFGLCMSGLVVQWYRKILNFLIGNLSYFVRYNSQLDVSEARYNPNPNHGNCLRRTFMISRHSIIR